MSDEEMHTRNAEHFSFFGLDGTGGHEIWKHVAKVSQEKVGARERTTVDRRVQEREKEGEGEKEGEREK